MKPDSPSASPAPPTAGPHARAASASPPLAEGDASDAMGTGAASAHDAMRDARARLRFLRSPAAHPGETGAATVIETHMSWVVLCGSHALKMKKPVRHAFLDFSTVDARERNAREEVRLNRRLAPDVYLDVLAVQRRGASYALVPSAQYRADGETVDWLVLMRRLPAASMLDRLIARGGVASEQVDALAATLVAFYRNAPHANVGTEAYLARLRSEQRVDRRVLQDRRFALDTAVEVLDLYDDALAAAAPLLRRRASERRLVEGHGDLRPEHVCMLQPPVVIDCLEFSPMLREVDPFDELAFLGMECALAGDVGIGDRLWADCAAALGDDAPAALHRLYTARRAMLRSRLMAAHLIDPTPRAPQRWLPRARVYLEVARQALQAS